MYLSEVFAENYRIFGAEGNGQELRLPLRPGLNALVGENDGGKSAIVDAIRYCLWTTSQEFHRFGVDDFHCGQTGRANTLRIRCKFDELDVDDQATFLEWLTGPEGSPPVLYLHLRATLLEGNRHGRVAVETHSGEHGEGPAIEGTMRELLKTTYLRPLRDAEAELSPGRNSRLSQILINHPEIATQAKNDFDPALDGSGKTLVGIMKRAEHEVGHNEAVQSANATINASYLGRFQIGPESLKSEVGVAGDTTLGRILEKLELVIAKPEKSAERTKRGLGFNNALFMSAELLLLGTREAYPTLLIEEPEAHLHPQMQASVIGLLKEKTEALSLDDATGDSEPDSAQMTNHPTRPVQVIMTTHSPTLASSIPLNCISIISGGHAYSLGSDTTRLQASDYAFLERFLDATKANLFFAKGVAIVEGDAENLLLPTLAEKVGYSFRENGLSIVNVGHTGLFRYSNIFRRQDGVPLPIRVACIRDRDIVPDCASDALKGKLKKESEFTPAQLQGRKQRFLSSDGGSVRTFISDIWTFEHDLAATSWRMARIVHAAVQGAVAAVAKWPTDEKLDEIFASCSSTVKAWETELRPLDQVAVQIYQPLREGDASKSIAAQLASRLVAKSDITEEDLPSYLVEAFKHLTGVADGPAA